MSVNGGGPEPGGTEPPYAWAAAAGLGVFLLYALTLAPTTAFWDASEYIASAHVLGIPHPPGNPLFVALGRSWSVLLSPLPLTVAQRVNLLAAATSAAAFGFFFLVAHRMLVGVVGPGLRSRIGAVASVALGATAYTVWSQSNVNEKVYTVSLLAIGAVSWLALRWHDRRDEPGSARLLLLAGYVMALGSTNHLMSVLPLPALGILVLLVRPRVVLRRRLWAGAAAVAAVGLSFSFFLPIRAAKDPVINEGQPTCESPAGAAVAVYTLGRAGCPGLAGSLTRAQYRKPPLTDRQAPLGDQLRNWLQYFDWQWARGGAPDPRPGGPRGPFTVLFGALGLLGLWAAWREERAGFAYVATLAVTLTVVLVYYLNFRYGYSLAPEISDPGLHEVRERDYFFIAGFALWGVLAGVGLTALWGSVSEWLTEKGRSGAWASPVLLLAGIPLVMNWGWADRSGDYAARSWAYDLLQSVEPYGVLFTNGDNDTFPLWYLQEVEGVRRDVTVVVGQYLYTDWYPRQLQAWTRPCGGDGSATARALDPGPIPLSDGVGPGPCQRPFEAAGAPELHSGTTPRAPDRPILVSVADSLDRIRGGVLPRDTIVEVGGFSLTYSGGAYLGRGDLLVLEVVRDVAGRRPVYFASTAGLMRRVGLDRWGVRHGLVTKLVLRSRDDEAPEGWVQTSPSMGGEWFALERSLDLLRDVYTYRSLADRRVWPDRSTLNVPWHFYALHLQLADALARGGDADPEAVARLRREARAFLVTARGGRVALPRVEPGGR